MHLLQPTDAFYVPYSQDLHTKGLKLITKKKEPHFVQVVLLFDSTVHS